MFFYLLSSPSSPFYYKLQTNHYKLPSLTSSLVDLVPGVYYSHFHLV